MRRKKSRLWRCISDNAENVQRGFRDSVRGNDKGKSSGCKNGTEDALIRLADTEHKLQRQIIELAAVSDEIFDAISKINDDDLETVLIHRYILFHTIEETAEIMNYSTETVRRKTNKAIRKLCENVLECGSLDVVE